MLTVSGARGVVGETMTPEVATRLAAAFAAHLADRPRGPAPVVCIGRDSRPSGAALAAAARAGLAAAGARVIDLGLVATPTAAIAAIRHRADGAIVVTASHNPAPWNGLKFIADGAALPPGDVAAVYRRFHDRATPPARAASVLAPEADAAAPALHVERVLDEVDLAAIRRRRFAVVLDSINGAGGPAGRLLLEALGGAVTHLNAEPTGRFAHEPEPIEANLGGLTEAVRRVGADVGFAQDPDADRLAIVDERGRYIGEECTLVLAAQRILDRADPRREVVLATNLSTSRMIDDVAAARGRARVVRSAVGEANVACAMRESGAIVGGEGNGGVILPSLSYVRDSLAAIALVLDLLAAGNRPLGAIVDALPRYVMVKRKIDAPGGGAIAPALSRLADALARRGARVDRADGVRADFADGWMHVRPSNTEPIVRVIAEAPSRDRAESLAEEARSLLG
jgi:phosphomannomutase